MDGTPLGNLAAISFLGFFLACGYIAGCALLPGEHWIARLWIGLALGLLMLMWLPALFAFALGFTLAAHLGALLAAAALAAGLYAWRRPDLAPSLPKGLLPLTLCVLPLTLLAAYLLWHHTLRPVGGALHTGQSGYGDMSMHLGFITSLARQGIFPPEYSILPGVKLGYPFLCDSISSSLYLAGASLRVSYILPALVAMALCFLGYYLLMLKWLGSASKAALAYWLFFLGGGLGFAYFFDLYKDNPANLTRFLDAYYQTPTNLIQQNIRWVNPIADMMLPQRATLFGWTLLLPCLYLLYRLTFEKGKGGIALGLLAGGMPMVHTHSFLALGLLSAALLAWALVSEKDFFSTARAWLPYALIALLLSLPQLLTWTFPQAAGDSFLRLHFNWANESDHMLWFYLKNIGVVFLFLLPAAIGAPRRLRVFWLCSLPIWLVAEFFVFQPNVYDNNKLLFVVFMLSCGLVASWLVQAYRRLKGIGGRRVVAAIVVIAGTLSGAMTLARECVSDLMLFSEDEVQAARYIDESLPTDAVILTAGNHNNAAAALAGRNLFCGSATYLYFHGVMDFDKDGQRRQMLADAQLLGALAQGLGITHAYIGPYERAEGALDEPFLDRFALLYENESARIFALDAD